MIGGSGFIGRVVVRQLIAAGQAVRVIGRQAKAPADLDSNADYRCGDYGDKAFLQVALTDATEVIDLAYSTVPKSSFDDPVHDITTNLPQAVNLFQTVTESSRIRKVVVVSSGGTVYGHPQQLPIPEGHPTYPISPYGITKLAVEKYAWMYHRLFGTPIVVVRPSNAYGPDQLPFRGQGFIATAIATIIKGQAVTVFGGDQIIRDYVHVNDLATGIRAALESGRAGSCYNLGSSIGRKTNEVLSLITAGAHEMGLEVKIEPKPMRAFDVRSNVLDCSRANTELDWRATTKFEEGLERVWEGFIAKTV